jgi:hypothetical protein
MRVLLAVLLVGIVGCGETDPTVAALKKFGAKIKQNEQGEGVEVSLSDTGLVHLKKLTELQELYLGDTQVTFGNFKTAGESEAEWFQEGLMWQPPLPLF